ncbi:MAG: acetamidase/formamidase family protein [Anaerolineae bacterium]|jgi:amidase|nr:acetamidase [Chloroflexota bacterium]
MDHRWIPAQYYNNFGTYPAALTVAPGDTVCTVTLDSRGRNSAMESLATSPNPLSGPIWVQGAEPGDRLVVKVISIRPNRRYGYACNTLAGNVVDPDAVPSLPTRTLTEWDIDVDAWTARLLNPPAALQDLELPLDPMLGCLGVAARGGQTISSSTSEQHGGNMDYRGIKEGVTLQFPVFTPGGLLFVGDGHAIQGDGEIVGMGIEVSMDVTLSIDLIKGRAIRWPRGMNEEYLFAMGNARPLDQALQHATTELLRWLGEDYNLDAEAASILLGQCVRYDIGNVFDPAYTVVARIPRKLVER